MAGHFVPHDNIVSFYLDLNKWSPLKEEDFNSLPCSELYFFKKNQNKKYSNVKQE